MAKVVKDGLKIVATVEFEIGKEFVDESEEKLKETLMGEYVKVNGGLYENIMTGSITKVKEVSPTKIEYEEVK